MNLHRASKEPDWQAITPTRRTLFQKVAALTYGVVTPANCISVLGLAAVLYGLIVIVDENYWLGLVLIAFGRLLDIADGYVAELTKTKSLLGEMVDAVIDKIVTLMTLLVFILTAVADWWVIGVLALPQLLILLVIMYKRRIGITLHPTLQGKLGMALAWLGIVGLLALKTLGAAPTVAVFVYSAIGASILLGLYALWQYASARKQS